ncbi:hypothetical protein Pelo_16872 [Pelomyxa schiedti]|nr:hypothetical protein Pelo_16872 [Pelomyxa schiedti]
MAIKSLAFFRFERGPRTELQLTYDKIIDVPLTSHIVLWKIPLSLMWENRRLEVTNLLTMSTIDWTALPNLVMPISNMFLTAFGNPSEGCIVGLSIDRNLVWMPSSILHLPHPVAPFPYSILRRLGRYQGRLL